MSKEAISSLPTSTINRLLFQYYTSMNGIQAYNSINKRRIKYKNKISDYLIEEGYIIQERILERIELWK